MKKLLIIKLTSLGDLIHLLPSIEDFHRIYPSCQIDWVIDEHFQEIASLHPAIHAIFPSNHRKWRKHPFRLSTLFSLAHLIRSIRKAKYDLVIDAQGNFKSGLLTLLAKGRKAGFDRKSVAEKIATLAYHDSYFVSKELHAISRLRHLFSLAASYPLPIAPFDYHIDKTRLQPPPFPLPKAYFLLIPNATWNTKLWPEAYWQNLIEALVDRGERILLPWGTEEELKRAHRLSTSPHVTILPKLSLKELGYIIDHAKQVISTDTGLGHFSAALGVPCLSIYGATNPKRIGTQGPLQMHLLPTTSCAPCHKKHCPFNESPPRCLLSITPAKVLQALDESEASRLNSSTLQCFD